MLDEFHDLVVTNDDISIYETEGLRISDLSFITVESFLGEKSVRKNQTQDLVNFWMNRTLGHADLQNRMLIENLLLIVPDETRDAIEEEFKESFIPLFCY